MEATPQANFPDSAADFTNKGSSKREQVMPRETLVYYYVKHWFIVAA